MRAARSVGVRVRRVLLVHNSPRIGRYFSALRAAIAEPEMLGCRVLARIPRSDPPAGTVEEIIDYGMRRRRARPHTGHLRLSVTRHAYRAAARLHYEHVRTWIRKSRPDALGVWGGNAVDARAVVVAAGHAGLPCFRFENGFLPDTTQMDVRGVNAASSLARVPEFYEKRAIREPGKRRGRITPRTPRRGKARAAPVHLPPRYIFVPFQVQLDSQLLLHSPWIYGMHHFFDVVTEAANRVPGGPPILVFKEHPSCPARYPELQARAAEVGGVLFANGNSTDELIRNACGVVTINSSVGTESLLLGRPVVALGDAIYGIAGVAASARSGAAVTEWLTAVWDARPPPAPLRGSFVDYLSEEYLIPDPHQRPGPAHFRAVQARLTSPGGVGWGEGWDA